MNRPIKFRAWDKEEKEMLYGNEIEFIYRTYDLTDAIKKASEWNILMQYIGLKDKNGVEIYEEDVIEVREFVTGQRTDYFKKHTNFKIEETNRSDQTYLIYRLIVVFNGGECKFGVKNIDGSVFSCYHGIYEGDDTISFNKSKIIGNTMENKELLK